MCLRKLEDFRKEDEGRVKKNVLETRYDFFHNKRFYKLGQIYEKVQEEKRFREQQRQEALLEKMRRKKEAKEKASEANDLDSRT